MILVRRSDDLTAPLDGWRLVHETVRTAAAAGTHEAARAAVDRARTRLADHGEAHARHLAPDEAAHLDAQGRMLEQVAHLVTATWVSGAVSGAGSSAPAPTLAQTGGADLELASTPVRTGDVLCLLRLSGALPRVELATCTSEYGGTVAAALRSSDEVLTIDERHLLVVMRAVSTAVAWRRMTGLLGERTLGTARVPIHVHAGLAPVGAAGPGAALEAARVALATLAATSTPGATTGRGWIALAPYAAPEGVA